MFSKNKEDGKAHKRESGMPSIISPGMRVTGNLSSEGDWMIKELSYTRRPDIRQLVNNPG